MKVKVECRIGSDFHREEIECVNYFIRDGAYIFIDKKEFNIYEFENVIMTYPVMFTIVHRLD